MNDDSADAVTVEAVARDYIEGWYTGDVARMDRSLHPELVKRIPDRDLEQGQLRSVTKARMVELTAEGGGSDPDAEVTVFVDDCAGDIASVRVLSPDYLDYLHLVTTTEGWKIANVIFHARDSRPTNDGST
jgi:hypothetical protein